MIKHTDLMLATDAPVPAERWFEIRDSSWLYQEKIDGIRCLARDGRLITRGGHDVTDRFPEIEAPKGWTLDTELAVVDAVGHADFEATSRRAQGGHGGDATLFIFDVLESAAGDQRHVGYLSRYLQFNFVPVTAGVSVLPIIRDPREKWLHVAEGLIARTEHGRYTAGRSKELVKLKKRDTVNVIVVGRTPGKGARADTFGALECAVIRDGEPVHVGEVGSGFTGEDLVDVMERFAAGRPFVVEVAALGRTSTGKLRQASFVRIRDDVDVLDVVLEGAS